MMRAIKSFWWKVHQFLNFLKLYKLFQKCLRTISSSISVQFCRVGKIFDLERLSGSWNYSGHVFFLLENLRLAVAAAMAFWCLLFSFYEIDFDKPYQKLCNSLSLSDSLSLNENYHTMWTSWQNLIHVNSILTISISGKACYVVQLPPI